MKILVGQPKNEGLTEQLKLEIQNNPSADIIIYPEGYLANDEALESACAIAEKYRKTIITGYKRNNKNRAVIVNSKGKIVLDRAKTPKDEDLYEPFIIENDGIKIGYLLCMEILKGLDSLKQTQESIDFIAHPIGVGMFSDEQFEEWITVAKSIAKEKHTIVIGTSHADGFLAGYNVSIPIAYCIDRTGNEVYISKSDIRTRIVDLYAKEVQVI